LLLDDSQDSLIVLLAALWTNSTQLNVLVRDQYQAVLDDNLKAQLTVTPVKDVAEAMEVVGKGAVGAITAFGRDEGV